MNVGPDLIRVGIKYKKLTLKELFIMLKVGVIGVGSISHNHIKPYLQNDNVELVALCDLNEQRLKEKGDKYGVTTLYTKYEELLENKDIDAVSICTWNNSHADIDRK